MKRRGLVAVLAAIAVAAVLLAGQSNAAANARAQEPSADNSNASIGNIQNGKRVFASSELQPMSWEPMGKEARGRLRRRESDRLEFRWPCL